LLPGRRRLSLLFLRRPRWPGPLRVTAN